MVLARALPVLVSVGLLALAIPAFAQEAPVATAPAGTGAAPGVAEQIDAYLKTSPAALPKEDATGVTPGSEPRRIHGVVDVAVGTGGYRSAYVQADVPIGQRGTLSIAAQEGRIDGRYGSGSWQNVGLGLSLGGDPSDPADGRCREAMGPAAGQRLDLAPMDRGRQRPCRAAEALRSPAPDLHQYW